MFLHYLNAAVCWAVTLSSKFEAAVHSISEPIGEKNLFAHTTHLFNCTNINTQLQVTDLWRWGTCWLNGGGHQSTSGPGFRLYGGIPSTPACTWWNRPEEDPSSGKLESTHPSRTSVKYDKVFFGVESIMRVNAASLDIRDATTSTPGTLNDLTTHLIMANNNNDTIERLLDPSTIFRWRGRADNNIAESLIHVLHNQPSERIRTIIMRSPKQSIVGEKTGKSQQLT